MAWSTRWFSRDPGNSRSCQGVPAGRRSSLPALFVAFLLAACTGTIEVRPPSLLIVGFGEAGAGEVGLIDVRLLEAGVPVEERLVVARRPLPEGGRPVAFDVVDRAGDRAELAVASRTVDDVYHLSFFDMGSIDVDDPGDFAEIAGRRVNLTEVAEALCPKRLAVSRDGRLLAAINDEAVCPDSDALMIVDLDTQEVTAIDVAPTGPVIRSGLYLEQETGLLYYLAEKAAAVNVRVIDPITQSDDELVDVPFATGQEAMDLGPVRDALLVLYNNAFVPIRQFETDASVGEEVGTVANSRRLLNDDFRSLASVLLHSTSQLAFHADVEDEDEVRSSTPGVTGGTLDSVNQFAYLVASGRVFVFDPLTPDLPVRSVGLAQGELEQPAFVTWVLAEFEEEEVF